MFGPVLYVIAGLVAASASAGVALAAAAAGHDAHGGGGGGGENPLSGSLGNLVWTLVIFVTLLVVLGKFAWGPLLSSLQQREDFIKDLVNKADRDRQAAANAAAEFEQKLATAKDEVRAIVDEGRKDADRLKADILAAANKEADETRLRVRREIETARDQALKEIIDTAAKLATDAAGKILKRELKPDDHRKLIQESLAAYRKN